jgi:hypothetical protein
LLLIQWDVVLAGELEPYGYVEVDEDDGVVLLVKYVLYRLEN